MRCVVIRSIVLGVLAGLSAASAHAQAQDGRIAGVVRDARGVGVEAARVTITSNATRAARSTSTGPDGRYTVSGLSRGAHTVAVSLVGFRRVSQTVQVTEATTVDVILEPLPLEAVTVTATLREQELADVPFSVAAPTASVLRERGADDIEDIAINVAGFSVQNLGPGQSQVAMRGASAGQIARDQPGVKEQVGAYLDDSPISLSLFTPDLDLFDITRVEVLRGPQGTLFGAGSLSGTVRYISGQPEFGVRSMFGEIGASWVDGGNGGAVAKVGANVPLGDHSAARFVVYHNQLGGYMDAVRPDFSVDENINSGTKTGARAAFRFAPNDRFSITPRVVVQSVKMDGWNRNDIFNIVANPFTTSRTPVTLGERELFLNIDEPFADDFVLGDVNMVYSFGAVNLTSITSYTYRDLLVSRDGGALYASIVGGSLGMPEPIYTINNPFYDATTSKVLTQELRLAGEGERFRWLVGGFFSSNQRDYGQSIIVSGFEAATGMPTRGLRAGKDELFFSDLGYDLRQTAVFGEATVSATDRLDLTAGVRYYNFSEDRDQVFDGVFAHEDNGTAVVSVPGSTDADGFAPRFIASFQANESVTLNAQASKGFRLGGINDPLNTPICTPEDLITFGGRDSWKDESAWNYEVGAKTKSMNGRFSLNLALFHMDISDLQVTVTAGSCSSRLIFNVPKAMSRGGEIELAFAPSERFDISASATLTNSELRSTVISTSSGGQVTVVSGIEEGNRLPSVPKVQGAASATWRWPLRAGANGFFTATFQHVGSRYTQIEDLAEAFGVVDMTAFEAEGGQTIGGPLTQPTFTFNPQLPAYSLVNLRAGLKRPAWELALFVNNATNERALLALDRERGTRARVGYLTNQPRTVGLTLGFNY